MSVRVRIPAPFTRLSGGKPEVKSEGGTVRELIENLDKEYSGIKEKILDENGEVRRFINIYVGAEDIRFSNGLDTPLKGVSEVSIVPAISGG